MIDARKRLDDKPFTSREQDFHLQGLKADLADAKLRAARRAAEQRTQKRRLAEITAEFGTAEDEFPSMRDRII